MPCTICQQNGHNKRSCKVEIHYDYDDCGIECRINPQDEDDWQPIEPHCLNCGHSPTDCECRRFKAAKWFDESKGKWRKNSFKQLIFRFSKKIDSVSADRKLKAVNHNNRNTQQIKMSSAVQSIKVKFIAPTHRGECGVIGNKLYFPFFMMGCCGDANAVVKVQELKAPKKINKEFFQKIATLLKLIPFMDWDWSSFRRNILTPNREHIQQEMGLDEFFTNRVMNDLVVVLNRWDKMSDEEEQEFITQTGGTPVSHRTFFTERECEF